MSTRDTCQLPVPTKTCSLIYVNIVPLVPFFHLKAILSIPNGGTFLC